VPSRHWRMRIEDILECVAKIEQYTAGMTFADFCADPMTVDAVYRNLEVIGEAARHIPTEIASRHPDVPWSRMRGMRNVLIHEYFGADLETIWKTIHSNLPRLPDALRRVLEENHDLGG